MLSTAQAPKRAKLFDSLVLEFTLPLRLKFDLFDFPLAQRWASLVCAYHDNGSRSWATNLPRPHRVVLHEEIEFLLRILCQDQNSIELIRKLELVDDVYSASAIEQIRTLPFFQPETASEMDSYQRHQIGMLKRKLANLESALKKKRKARITGIPIFPEQLKKLAVQPFENKDFAHFRNERLPGGLRLRPENENLSAISCTESTDLGRMHSPSRNFGPGFRIDLAPAYPTADKWETHQNLMAWAEANDFDMADPRNWAECVYVARLCAEDLSRIREIAEIFANATELELKSISLIPAIREQTKIELNGYDGSLGR